ncbi:porin family protein [Algoriphagus terrigena]|uniref:porin family protein n=1 Tax=Algoriphagus terrigena TaxID=344884 RepID=UPI00068681DB|nr:porin family protein [Algoriphagus terrigena]
MLRILFFVLAFAFTTSINAQDVKYGFRLGFSITTFEGEDSGGKDTNFRNGFSLGAFTSLPISSAIRFEPGVDFATKGAKTNLDNVNSLVRNGYLDIPLLFDFQLGERFSIIGGPQPSFLLSSAMIFGEGDTKITVKGAEAKALWKDTDIAGVFGLGYSPSKTLQIQLIYEHGFANISEISNSVYNRAIKTTVKAYF